MNVDAEKIKALVKSIKPLFMDHKRASQIKVKGVSDFVTQVDFQVQETMKEGLRSLYPQIQFMGEEKDNSDIDFSGSVWILDPVDGTTNLIHDFRQSALSLALCTGGVVELGIIYQPYTDEMFWAVKGQGAWLGDTPIHVSQVDTLERSLVSIGTCPYDHSLAEKNFKAFQEIFLHCSDIRRMGSAAIDLAYVACGRTEAFFERSLKPWDFAAGLLLVEEAGGKVTDFNGDPVDVTGPSQIMAGNGCIGDILAERFLR
ncbi:inositol monophosphatase family protein [Lacrimispora sp. 210928-DFI.3.58]|uniref:inositol monophosphatase family protein n=1 Tax=Lacrimispora sp. 210928-DFI.3.58 TaxID=2883214 RepID=UPI001D099D5F|nr:inositol monophosphatase family protein [Lacrimispora sp. 210928-DFI.3.58]MCB7320839.1 inositol monophosphatase [Lacrimispora sp. 210928-DFI.3.58]